MDKVVSVKLSVIGFPCCDVTVKVCADFTVIS